MKNLHEEMQAFVEGRNSSFTTLLPSLPTSQIETLNQYLTVWIGEPAQEHGVPYSSATTPGLADGALLNPEAGTGASRSLFGLVEVQLQIDEQLVAVRMELQSVFGLLPDAELTIAAAQFDNLSMTALIDGTKRSTLGVMELLDSSRGTESSLVNDVWQSMGQVMHLDSFVMSDTPLDGLFQSWELSAVSYDSLLNAETGKLLNLVMAPETRDSTSENADAVLLDLMHAATPIVPIIPAGHASAAGMLIVEQETSQNLLLEDLFKPLSDSTNVDPGQPGADFRLDKLS